MGTGILADELTVRPSLDLPPLILAPQLTPDTNTAYHAYAVVRRRLQAYCQGIRRAEERRGA